MTVDCSEDPRLWVACVVGATVDENLLAMFRDAVFEGIMGIRRGVTMSQDDLTCEEILE